jgi:hypothetical protein
LHAAEPVTRPTPRPRRTPLHLTLATIVVAYVFGVQCLDLDGSTSTSSASGFGQQQLECQAATALLVQCCPGFDANGFVCDYTQSVTSGCNGTSTSTTYPSLSASEVSCILGETCSQLVATGVCRRADARATMGPDTIDTYSDSGVDVENDFPDTAIEEPSPDVGCFRGEPCFADASVGEGGSPEAGEASTFEGGGADGSADASPAADGATDAKAGADGSRPDGGSRRSPRDPARHMEDPGSNDAGAPALVCP